MRKLLLAALLLTATDASATVARLKPVTAALNAPVFQLTAPVNALAPSFAGRLMAATALTPSFTIPAAAPALTLSAPALPPSVAHPKTHLTPLPSAAPEEGARPAIIDALRNQGEVSIRIRDNGDAAAAETSFFSAANLGALIRGRSAETTPLVAPADSPAPGGGLRGLLGRLTRAAPAPRPATDGLHGRLLERIKLDGRGKPAEEAALTKLISRMLESPTARKYAEEFIEEGLTATVRFDDVEGTKIHDFEGRKIFYTPRAFTDWQEGGITIRLNSGYLESDPEYFAEDAPATLAHELLGHGLWYGRMAKYNMHTLFHVHENNELNAKLVGWLTAWELEKRFHDTFAWEYLSDPARFMEGLKIRQPYYATTYTTEQMSDPLAALEKRLDAVQTSRADYEAARSNVLAWKPVVDHFINAHGVPAERFGRINDELIQREATLSGYIQDVAAVEQIIQANIDFYRSDAGQDGLAVMKTAASYPQFVRLQSDVDLMTADLRALATQQEARPAAPPAPWPEGQIDWDELKEMFNKDSREHPSHWATKP